MATSLARITPHPLAIRERIRQLTDELKLARRMLAIAVRARAEDKQPAAKIRKAVRS